MAIGQVLVAILSTFINAFPNRKLLNYNYFEQIKDLFPSLIISIIMFIIVYSFNFINLNMYILLFIQILVGVIIYFGLAYIFKLESLNYMIEILKSFSKKKEVLK